MEQKKYTASMFAHYVPCGDRMVLVEFANEISPEVHREVYRLFRLGTDARIAGIVEWVPSYRSLGVIYDPLQVSSSQVIEQLKQLRASEAQLPQGAERHLEVPVAYGGEFGPDLSFVAEFHGFTAEQVVSLHSGAEYRVYLIGFMPGFPYLGGLPPELATPRLESPRDSVPAGSVAIGGQQTGIYPSKSPGGWRLIGRTPLRLFDFRNPQPSLLQVGDRVTFRPISGQEFEEAARLNSVL